MLHKKFVFIFKLFQWKHMSVCTGPSVHLLCHKPIFLASPDVAKLRRNTKYNVKLALPLCNMCNEKQANQAKKVVLVKASKAKIDIWISWRVVCCSAE